MDPKSEEEDEKEGECIITLRETQKHCADQVGKSVIMGVGVEDNVKTQAKTLKKKLRRSMEVLAFRVLNNQNRK